MSSTIFRAVAAPIFASALRRAKRQTRGGDIRDAALMRELVGACDIVFHQAALRITHCVEEPRAALETMVDGTFALAQLCADVGVEKIIYASSASVYGMAETFLISGAPPTPMPTGRSTALPSFSAKASSVRWRRLTSRCATSTFTVHAWTFTAGTPKSWFGGWSGSKPAIRRSCSAMACRRWTSSMSGTSRERTFLLPGARLSMRCSMSPAGIETSLVQLAAGLAAAMGRPQLGPTMQASRGTTAVERRGWRR